MKIDVRKKGKIDIVDFSGTLTIAEGDVVLRDRFQALLDAGDSLFIFNMTQVPYMDSAGLGETAACSKRACERNGRIKIVVSPNGKVEQILRITRLDRAFEIFHDEEEALASFVQ